MANDNGNFFNWIKSKVVGANIFARSIIEYDQNYNISALPNNALITKAMLSAFGGNVIAIPFTTATSAPMTITNWNTAYAPTYGNGLIRVWYIIARAPDIVQEQFGIPINRIKDTATNTFQDSVQIDPGIFAFDGVITIQFSNVPLP